MAAKSKRSTTKTKSKSKKSSRSKSRSKSTLKEKGSAVLDRVIFLGIVGLSVCGILGMFSYGREEGLMSTEWGRLAINIFAGIFFGGVALMMIGSALSGSSNR